MSSDVGFSVVANALLQDVEVNTAVTGAVGVTPDLVEGARRRFGGLWVGGRLTLTGEALSFRPNRVNASIQSGRLAVDIPLVAVEEVLDLPGVLTKIIGVVHDGRTDRFRTWRARRVARRIRAAAAAARPGAGA